jgi:thioredoxin-like negative regulator of GroEL
MSAHVARRYFMRGREHMRRAEWDDAERELAAALELSPAFVEARVGYALTVARLDPPRAAQTLRHGLSRGPTRVERRKLLETLADVLIAGGDFLAAEETLAEAARLPGVPARQHDRLARLHAKRARYAEAFAELLRASSR